MKLMTIAVAVVGLMVVTAPASSMAANAANGILPASITVVGQGKVYAKPDQANIQMGVSTEDATAAKALEQNNVAMSSLMQTLKAAGVEDKDVQTSNFSIYHNYRSVEPSGSSAVKNRTTQYRVNNDVRVKVRNVANLGKLLDAVVKSGANNVNGVSFSFVNPEALTDEARKLAVADAQRKAKIYATAAGVSLGGLLYLDETVNNPYRAMNFRGGVMGDSSSNVPITTGEQEVSVGLNVVYTIAAP